MSRALRARVEAARAARGAGPGVGSDTEDENAVPARAETVTRPVAADAVPFASPQNSPRPPAEVGRGGTVFAASAALASVALGSASSLSISSPVVSPDAAAYKTMPPSEEAGSASSAGPFPGWEERVEEQAAALGLSNPVDVRLAKLLACRVAHAQPEEATDGAQHIQLRRLLSRVLNNKRNALELASLGPLLARTKAERRGDVPPPASALNAAGPFAASPPGLPLGLPPGPPLRPPSQSPPGPPPGLLLGPPAPGTDRSKASRRLGALFPTEYHVDIALGRPQPPRLSLRPRGRARPRVALFATVLSFLDPRTLCAVAASCRGTAVALREDPELQGLWRALALRLSRCLAVQDRADFARLWGNLRYATVLAYGVDVEAVGALLGTPGPDSEFRTLLVGRELPCVSDSDADVPAALFCAAKACSPCVVLVRDPSAVATEPRSQAAAPPPIGAQGRGPSGFPNTATSLLLRGAAPAAERTGAPREWPRTAWPHGRTHRRELSQKDLAALCDLVHHDLSGDAVVVACVTQAPWRVQASLLQRFGTKLRLGGNGGASSRASSAGSARPGSARPGSSGKARISRAGLVPDGRPWGWDSGKERDEFKDDELPQQLEELAPLRAWLTRLAPDLSENQLSAFAAQMCGMDAEAVARVQAAAVAALLRRVRAAEHFCVRNGLWEPCDEVQPGARAVRCADLPVSQIRYGACSRQELAAAIEAERTNLAALRRAPDLQQRRIEQWEAVLR
jgi:hypothetical protein